MKINFDTHTKAEGYIADVERLGGIVYAGPTFVPGKGWVVTVEDEDNTAEARFERAIS